MAPQTVSYQVFLAACQGRSFPDPHCSCQPALLALIFSWLQGTHLQAAFLLGLSVPACSPGFPLPLPDGLQGRLCASWELLQPRRGAARHRSWCKLMFMKLLGLGVATKDVPSGALRLYPSCCPGQRGAVRVLPPLLSLLNIPTAKAVDLEAIFFLSASSPFLPASPDPVVSLLLRVHKNPGLGADEPQVPDN